MTDIPTDIMNASEAVHTAILGRGTVATVNAIAFALLAERKRCAAIIDERKTAAIYLAGRGHASIGTNIVVHGFDEIAAAIMKGPTT